jgi:hypothetical protein
LELEPAHCYSPDPAGSPGQLLQHACVTPGHKADRRCHRSPTSPPRFPHRLFVDRHPRSHATHRRCAHGPSPPTISPHVHPMSNTDHATGFIHAHLLLPRCPPFPRRFPQARTAPRASPPSDLILRVLGLRSKGRFLHLPTPIFTPPLSLCPALLSAAACCHVKPSEQQAVRHPVPRLTQCHHEGHLQSRCLLPCFPVGAPSSRASSVNLSPDWHLTELRCHPAMLHSPANCTQDRRPTSLTGVPLPPRFTVVDSIAELLSTPFLPPN